MSNPAPIYNIHDNQTNARHVSIHPISNLSTIEHIQQSTLRIRHSLLIINP